MATISIKRKHNLGYKKAHEITDQLAGELSRQFDATCQWQGEELRFSRTGAQGCVRIREDEVEVEVKLGMLLSPLKGKMESVIDEKLDRLLTS